MREARPTSEYPSDTVNAITPKLSEVKSITLEVSEGAQELPGHGNVLLPELVA